MQLQIEDLYIKIAQTKERKLFQSQVKRAEKDIEFEKYFRVAFLKIFLGT